MAVAKEKASIALYLEIQTIVWTHMVKVKGFCGAQTWQSLRTQWLDYSSNPNKTGERTRSSDLVDLGSPFTSTLPTTSAVPYPFHTSQTYVPVSLGCARSISSPVTLCRKRVSGSSGLLSFSQRYLGAGWPDALQGNSTRCDAITSRRSKLSRICGAEFAGSGGDTFCLVKKNQTKQ